MFTRPDLAESRISFKTSKTLFSHACYRNSSKPQKSEFKESRNLSQGTLVDFYSFSKLWFLLVPSVCTICRIAKARHSFHLLPRSKPHSRCRMEWSPYLLQPRICPSRIRLLRTTVPSNKDGDKWFSKHCPINWTTWIKRVFWFIESGNHSLKMDWIVPSVQIQIAVW